MAANGDVEIVRAKAREMTLHFVSVLLDSLFLALWAPLNVYLGHFIESLNVVGTDGIVLRCLQLLFGIYTLAPICIWTYKDLRIMIKRANRDIQAAGIAPIAVAAPASGDTITVEPEASK